MTSPRIDAVLPLTTRDWDRAAILFRTLPLFRDLGTLHVVVPDSQIAEMAARGGLPERARLVRETEVVPELPHYRRLFRASVVYRRRPDGWYVQQLVKIGSPAIVQTDFFLSLDADIICLRPVGHADLVEGGRSLCQRYPRSDRHATWYAWSERVLGLTRSARWNHGVTPILYSCEGLRLLHRFLEERVHPVFRGLFGTGPWTSWRGFLLRNLPWAEHTLYYIFLEHHGLYERFHRDIGRRPLYSCDANWREQFEGWPPPEIGDDENGPYFTTVQSSIRIPPAEVWERIAPHVERQLARL